MTDTSTPHQAATASMDNEVDLGILFSQLRRKLFFLLMALGLGLVFGILVYMALDRKYTANTTLMVNLDGQAASQQPADVLQSLTLSSTEAVTSAFAIANSSRLFEQVAEAENLVADPEFNSLLRDPGLRSRVVEGFIKPVSGTIKNALGVASGADAPLPDWREPKALQERFAAAELEKRVVVKDLQDGLQLEIAVTTQEPEKSARLANAMAVKLNEFMRDTKASAIESAKTWITNEVGRIADILEGIEREIIAAIADGSAVPTAASLGQSGATTLNSNSERLVTSEVILEEGIARIAALTRLGEAIARIEGGELASVALGILTEPMMATLADDYAQILSWADRGREPNQADLLGAQRQVERDIENQRLASLRTEREIIPIRAQTRKLSTAQNRYLQLRANYVANETLLNELRLRLAGLEIERAGDVQRMVTLEDAKPPLRHATPSLLPTLLGGALFGLLIGIGLVILRFFRRDPFYSLEDVEQTFGAPTIAVVSDISARFASEFHWERLSTEVAEAYRRVYAAVFVVRGEDESHTLMVTSSIPSEGKTTSSLYIAAAAAEERKSTLVIDLDFRKRSVSRYLGLENKFGVFSVFRGEVTLPDAIVPYPAGGFDVLTTDGRQKSSDVSVEGDALGRETLSVGNIKSLIDQAKEHYQVIVIDVPPILAVQDATMIGRMCDTIVSVVSTESMQKKAGQRAAKEWRRAGIKLFGLIVRGEKSELQEYYGYDYYHYNYASADDTRKRRIGGRVRVLKRKSGTTRRKASQKD